jgi:hypothetical protein
MTGVLPRDDMASVWLSYRNVAAIVICATTNFHNDCFSSCINPSEGLSEGLLITSVKILPCRCQFLLLLLHGLSLSGNGWNYR